MPPITRPSLALVALLAPVVARAAPIGPVQALPVQVFVNATIINKALILCLCAATVACVVIGVRKLVAGPDQGGSAFVSSLRLGGPVAGALGAAYALICMSVGLAHAAAAPSMQVLAPGFAEAATLIALGLFAGVVAVAFNWAIVARIDRSVLGHG